MYWGSLWCRLGWLCVDVGGGSKYYRGGGGVSKYYDSILTPRSKYYIIFWPGVILPRGQNTIPHRQGQYLCDLAPVPLSIFRSNSKFDENSECSSFEYTRPITTIFCTRHDSDTVVTCAKYRCDRPRIINTRVFWIFIEFRIRSKYA